MKRKIYDELLNWKNEDAGRTALLVCGAARVGKSSVAEEFAKNEYKSHIVIDFKNAPKDITDMFSDHVSDQDMLFMYLSAFYNVKLYERETLFILDEVQVCPNARDAVKHLVADGRYDYLGISSIAATDREAGGLLLPPEEKCIRMYPLDFEEFLWALGCETFMPQIKYCFENGRPMGEALHRKAMDYFRQYLIVGGMPEAVAEYAESKDLDRVDRVKRGILDFYRNDIIKNGSGHEVKAEQIFEGIPAQLQKHDKKFRLSLLKKEARFRDYENAMMWLAGTMIVNMCYNSTAPNVGLELNMDRKSLKCYMADTGLLLSQAFSEKIIAHEKIYKNLLFGRLELSRGMLVENMVAQMLAAHGHRLYFYSNSSREDAHSRMGIDFLISEDRTMTRHNISPIKVKSSKNYTLTSLRKFRRKFHEQMHSAYVIHSGDFEEKDGVIYLPLYMTPLI